MEHKKSEGKKFKEWLKEQGHGLPPSALRHVLEGLLPYTQANFALAFKPNAFFNELNNREMKRGYALTTLKNTYYAAKQRGLITVKDGQPALSQAAQSMLQPYEPSKLVGACIMVVFDIPENERHKRQWLRLLLRELKFQKIQQSVWVTNYECRDILQAGITEKSLGAYIQTYEARELA